MHPIHARHLRKQTVILFATVLGALLGIMAWFLVDAWTAQRRQHEARLLAAAQLVRLAADEQLSSYAQALRLAALGLRIAPQPGDAAALHAALETIQRQDPSVRRLAAIGPNGQVLLAAGIPAPAPLPADLLQRARAHPNTLVAPPARIGADRSGPWLGVGLAPADGEGMVLVAEVDLARANALYAALLRATPSGANMALGVIDGAGHLYGRWPLPAAADPVQFLGSQRVGAVSRHGGARAPGIFDGPLDADPSGRPYMGAIQPLEAQGLSAFVVTPHDALLNAWWRQVRVALGASLLLALALVLMLARELARQGRELHAARLLAERSQAAHDAQVTATNQFIQILNELPGGVIVFGANGRVQYCSGGFARLAGIAIHPRELIGRPWREIWHMVQGLHVGGADALRHVRLALRERQPVEDEIWARDGRVFLRHYTPLFARNGLPAGALWSVQDVTERRRQEARIRELAERDTLTGLANRAAFERLLDESLRLGTPNQTLGIADLDDFKAINDRLGHAAGDALLVEVARRLRGALRTSDESRRHRGVDLLARIGGDEFAVVLPHISDARQLQRVADRLMAALAAPIDVGGQLVTARLSLGFAMRSADEDPQTLMRQADMALYAAKAAGRNQWSLFTATMQADMEARQGWITAVEQALAEDRLELHGQPIVHVDASHRTARHGVSHVEVLLRLRDAQGQLHAAGAFEHVLDEARLAAPIGRWVLGTAVAWAAAAHAAGHELTVSVNISPRHFLGARFVDDVDDVLRRHPGLPPAALMLELTEHGALLDSEATRGRIEACHALGVQVALDDFGTGSASLIHLQALAVSTLKIERRFIKDVLHDARDLSITYGILRTAQLIGVRVVAEGVETPELARVLAAMGCRHLQGYAIARPMALSALDAWLRDWPRQLPWIAELGSGEMLGADGVEAIVSMGTILRQLLQGSLDDDTRDALLAPDATQRCMLGQWFQRQGARWRHHAQFVELREAHLHPNALARRWIAEPQSHAELESVIEAAGDTLRERFWAFCLHARPAVFVLDEPPAA